MKTNLLFYDPIFTVDMKNKVITCEIRAIPKSIENMSYYPYIKEEEARQYISKDYIIKGIGKAKCKDTDIFDLTKGKRIAESRAKIKIYRKAYKFFRAVITSYLKAITHSNKFILNNCILYHKEITHLEELCR